MFDTGFELYKKYLRLEKAIQTDKSFVTNLEFEAARRDWLNFKFWNKNLAIEIEIGWE